MAASSVRIDGWCDERFARVRENFERNFAQFGDVGACFAATVEGEFVVDLWGGSMDAARRRPWQRDTLVNVYSTTKTMTFLAVLVLADRGLLDFDARVADYWPEYGCNGKQDTTVRQVLGHSAGVPGFDPPLAAKDLYDWRTCIRNIERQAPWWPPGARSGYHAMTQGYLIGELVRRISGSSIGAFFRDEIARPLAADFHIGLASQHCARVAEMLPDPELARILEGISPDSLAARVFGSAPVDTDAVNSDAWRAAQIPAAGGHGNARAVVRAQTPLANDGRAFGVDLLRAETCRIARRQPTGGGTDPVLGLPVRYGLGYAFPSELLPVSPNPGALFWGGAGGSTVVIDPDARACFSYAMNQMRTAIVGDRRARSLGRAFYASLRG